MPTEGSWADGINAIVENNGGTGFAFRVSQNRRVEMLRAMMSAGPITSDTFAPGTIVEYSESVLKSEKKPKEPEKYSIKLETISESPDYPEYYIVRVMKGKLEYDSYSETSKERARQMMRTLRRRFSSRYTKELAQYLSEEGKSISLSGDTVARYMRPSLSRVDRRRHRPSEDVVNESGLVIPELKDEPEQRVEQSVVEEMDQFDDWDEEVDF